MNPRSEQQSSGSIPSINSESEATTSRTTPTKRRRRWPLVAGLAAVAIAASGSVAFAEARTTEFQDYSQKVADNAKSLAEGFLTRGANLVTGGTDNHIVLLDVSSFGLTGRQAESALLDAGVVTNRN